MSNIEIGVAGIAIALALIALRVPIGIALGLVSIIGISELTNMRVAWGMISATPFDFAGTWELTAAPMFLFMGYLCTSTRMTQGLFHAMRLYLARLPGGLAVSSVMASAFFAAASGSSVATSAAMSRIAVPEMLKHHYDKGLATGTVAASGTLGSLIPPSVLLVLYGVYAQVSVGQLFMAGFIPGVLSALLYIAMIMVRTKLNPSLAGDVDVRSTWDEKWDAFKDIWPLPLLIGSVLGGIFLGVFSPTEAGAVGTTIAAVIAFARRSLTMEAIKEALVSTAVSTASIFIILIGSLFFTRFLAMSGVPAAFSELILGVSTETWWIILAVALIYLVLGMFIDSIGLLLLTLPLILPLVEGADLNLIWFGIIVVKLLEVGLVTPPIGLNVYVIKGALGKSVTLSEVFRGVSWFIVMDVIALLLIVLIPALSLYLPQKMF
ncbi:MULTISPECIES: TRAP transporter large permease [Halomonadaceae]|jgi:tripartite ATP-independent transporter DctM subunit|uniref:TRAP transporter large permease protein n=1 Tax=Vreelandella janggokensis TaxID=370767 RepID=A0ABT4IPW7_9GAMM|nr:MULTISPECIES: TRAP transporter large permease subunit [Halomonas]MCO7246793.1 TRAP transporter large permease subunit [Halomonas sp. Mc5H-6]MCW4152646.1 TRAP transporter large permease subunit [Halomonas sp. 18H]MCZ0925721.1 TRAP transporter large permease subunit [Halomonas janggokensis]QPL47246.1 TRAP transporter large permease subunit [Halomonas sp. A40-4]